MTKSELRGCRRVCMDNPGELQDQLAEAMKDLREKGVPEAKVRAMARDPAWIASLFPPQSLGAIREVAEVMVSTQCAECAVDKAYWHPRYGSRNPR